MSARDKMVPSEKAPVAAAMVAFDALDTLLRTRPDDTEAVTEAFGHLATTLGSSDGAASPRSDYHPSPAGPTVTVVKQSDPVRPPKVSLILLDWSCRDSFHALDWLARQDAPREDYELIWVELYDRVVPEAMEKADVVITCGQQGTYHKHVGYNVGLLHSKGQIITVCDSDAVFPPEFISSISESFNLDAAREPASIVLMHYEQRTLYQYPEGLRDMAQLQSFLWMDLWPNVGAYAK